jgi:hypothetical protein
MCHRKAQNVPQTKGWIITTATTTKQSLEPVELRARLEIISIKEKNILILKMAAISNDVTEMRKVDPGMSHLYDSGSFGSNQTMKNGHHICNNTALTTVMY